MLSVYKKELRSYLVSFTGPAVMAFILLFSGIFVSMYSFFSLTASIETSYANTLFVLLVAVPVLSMKSLAEERHSKTDLLLSSLPLRVSSVVLGKFFAMLTVISIPLIITFLYTFILSAYGKVNFLSSFCATFAFILCAGAMCSVGLFISSLFDSIAVAATVSFAALLVIYFLPTVVLMIPGTSFGSFAVFSALAIILAICAGFVFSSRVAGYTLFLIIEGALLALLCFFPVILEGSASKVMSLMSFTERFDSFATYGIFDITAVVYFLSVSVFFIFLTVNSLDRRYRG